MRIMEILKEAEDDFGITEVVYDAEFITLGLVISDIDLTYCTFIDEIKYIKEVKDNVTMIITTSEVAKLIQGKGVCISSSPRASFFKIHNYLTKTKHYRIRKEFDTQIGQNCKISNMASIAKKNVRIGNNVIIEEFVSIRENTTIGDNVFIGSGAIIGGEGFEFKRIDDIIMAVTHFGSVKIDNNVSIQYNTCIDKAIYPWDDTVIGEYSKLDNLIQIGHAVKIGKNCMIAGQTVIGGRTVIKDNVWVGPGVTISNGIMIEDNSRINLGSVVVGNVKKGESVTGNFAIDTRKFLKHIKRLEL